MRLIVRVCACLAVLMGAVFAVLVLHPATAGAAAEGFNVITSPLPIKITTPPGSTVTTELRVKNQGDQAEGIKVGLMKFGATGSDGTPDIANLGPKDTYANWVHFSPQQFVAQPNIWYSITMTINVPADAGLGYYLAVTYSPASLPGVTQGEALKGSVATLVLLEVKTANEKRTIQLVSFTSSHKLYEYLPATFNIKLHNSGNIYIAPAGNIFITRGGGSIDTLDFNDAGGSILPDTNRVFSVPWSNGFPHFVEKLVNGKPVPDSHDVPEENLKWDFTQIGKLRIGHYTAKLLVVYDNGTTDVPLEAEVGFWVLPWKIMLVLLAVLLLIGFAVFSLVRTTARRARSGMSKLKQHASKKS